MDIKLLLQEFYENLICMKQQKQLINNQVDLKIIHLDTSIRDIETRISQITDYLFLSDITIPWNKHVLRKLCIRRVLSILDEEDMFSLPEEEFKHKKIYLGDDARAKIHTYFHEAYVFIKAAHDAKERVLVHCAAGISRSATLVIVYLMIRYTWSLRLAHDYVMSKRDIICPNTGFMRQLRQSMQGRKRNNKYLTKYLWHILTYLNIVIVVMRYY